MILLIPVRSLPIITALFLVLVTVITPATAFVISNYTLAKGPVYSGDTVNISYDIVFPPTNTSETFPPSNDLILSTELENATWHYSIILDGIDYTQRAEHGNKMTLVGFILSYKSGVEESVHVQLDGDAPAVPSFAYKNLTGIQQIGSDNLPVSEYGILCTILPVP